ncbi:hypothetical protein ACWGE0_22935 [Lentzea sp. NPDC054927]
MSDQGKTYLGFVEAELKAERERRTAFEARGQALVTSSGALVTLLVGLAAIVKTAATPQLTPWVLGPVGTALLLFATAGGCGVIAGWNRHYAVAATGTLRTMLAAHWIDNEVDARNHTGSLLVSTLATLRSANNFKARWVTIGLIVQVSALIALAVAVLAMIIHV